MLKNVQKMKFTNIIETQKLFQITNFCLELIQVQELEKNRKYTKIKIVFSIDENACIFQVNFSKKEVFKKTEKLF